MVVNARRNSHPGPTLTSICVAAAVIYPTQEPLSGSYTKLLVIADPFFRELTKDTYPLTPFNIGERACGTPLSGPAQGLPNKPTFTECCEPVSIALSPQQTRLGSLYLPYRWKPTKLTHNLKNSYLVHVMIFIMELVVRRLRLNWKCIFVIWRIRRRGYPVIHRVDLDQTELSSPQTRLDRALSTAVDLRGTFPQSANMGNENSSPENSPEEIADTGDVQAPGQVGEQQEGFGWSTVLEVRAELCRMYLFDVFAPGLFVSVSHAVEELTSVLGCSLVPLVPFRVKMRPCP